MTDNTVWVVLAVAACLLSAFVPLHWNEMEPRWEGNRKGMDPLREAGDIHLTPEAGTDKIIAKWNDDYPIVTVTWKDEFGRRGRQTQYEKLEATIPNLRLSTLVRVSLRSAIRHESKLDTKTIRTLTKAPSRANQLQSLNTTAQNVSLAWERPNTKCPISEYIITYSRVDKSGHRNRHPDTKIIVHRDATNYTVVGLHPGTDYTMAVAARNGAWLGQRKFIHVSTPEGVPSRPSKLESFSNSSNSITLTWKEPEEPNGVLRNYSVSWYEDGKEVGGTAVPYLTHTIVGLSPCVEYRVRVAANTGAGEGEYEEVTQTTAAAPPNVHNAICTIAPDAQEVTMTWSKPESACPITGYELFWQNDTEQPFASINDFTDDPFSSYTAKMPSEKHSAVCVAAMLHEERGQRTCCLNDPHP